MKIYHLTIAYNEKTEEIEYIQEEVEETSDVTSEEFMLELEEGYYDQETLEYLLANYEIGEA